MTNCNSDLYGLSHFQMWFYNWDILFLFNILVVIFITFSYNIRDNFCLLGWFICGIQSLTGLLLLRDMEGKKSAKIHNKFLLKFIFITFTTASALTPCHAYLGIRLLR
jgi:hypothetical protein